jgi:hypothetical protein
MPDGTQITMRGRANRDRLCTRWMKYRSIRSVMSASEITPSLSGRIARTWLGVRPIIRLASAPTATILPVCSSMATTLGSSRTTPRPRT